MQSNPQNSESLKKISNGELISRIEKLARAERKITHLVLLHIIEIEQRKLFADLGFDGMYAYLTKGLGYSDGAAHRRLQSARLLKRVPEIAVKIENGSLNLSQLTQVQKCLKESKKKGESISTHETLDLLGKLENKNTFETQKTLAYEMDLPIQNHEKLTPQKDESVRIELTLTKEQFAELEMAKSLLSHLCPDGNWADVVATLAEIHNRRKNVGRDKSTRSVVATGFSPENNSTCGELKECHIHGRGTLNTKLLDQSQNEQQDFTVRINAKFQRKNIPITQRRILLNKAAHRCEFVDSTSGKKCQSRYQLEVEHKHPVALGGSNNLENLRIFCRAHNALAARQWNLGNGS